MLHRHICIAVVNLHWLFIVEISPLAVHSLCWLGVLLSLRLVLIFLIVVELDLAGLRRLSSSSSPATVVMGVVRRLIDLFRLLLGGCGLLALRCGIRIIVVLFIVIH